MKELGDDERSNEAGGGLFRVNVATTYLQFLQLNELVLLLTFAYYQGKTILC